MIISDFSPFLMCIDDIKCFHQLLQNNNDAKPGVGQF